MNPKSRPYRRRTMSVVVLLLALMVSACATAPPSGRDVPSTIWLPRAQAAAQADAARYAPALTHDADYRRHNRPGTPSARRTAEGDIEVYVDPAAATMYYRRRTFTGRLGAYTNYIYRVHFEQVPFDLVPFQITAGPNGGLLMVVTVNAAGQPVLLTTVHSCGCYIAFVATSNTPREALPGDWPATSQRVFGETLPTRIDWSVGEARHALVKLRADNHRVRDVDVVSENDLPASLRRQTLHLDVMSALDSLAVDGETVSFFRTEPPNLGYVRDTGKPLERLLMSWWVFDADVGVDKRYAPASELETRFYTSLKPWRREESDMWEFARFLEYWGWKL